MRSILSCIGIGIASLAVSFLAAGVSAQVIQDSVPELQKLTIDEHLGNKIPLDLTFTNEKGETVQLASYFRQGKPVILNLVYLQCPMLCSIVLNGVTDAVKKLDWLPGNEFQIVTISFNPNETSDLAAAKRTSYLNELSRAGAENGWTFLVGPEANSRAVADALGFHYYYVPETKEYAHSACTFVLSPDGKISRYLYGIQYNERDVRFALLEASEGKIGNTIDKLILYCYHYDPDAKGYVVLATSIMKLGGGLVVVGLAVFLGLLWRRERHTRRTVQPALKRT
jgi:protein SCO1/2